MRYSLDGLHGDNMHHHLAALGLLWALRDHHATLHYENHTPVLSCDLHPEFAAHFATKALMTAHYGPDITNETQWPPVYFSNITQDIADYHKASWGNTNSADNLTVLPLGSEGKDNKIARNSRFVTKPNHTFTSGMRPIIAELLDNKEIKKDPDTFTESLIEHFAEQVQYILEGGTPIPAPRPGGATSFLGLNHDFVRFKNRYSGEALSYRYLDFLVAPVIARIAPRGRMSGKRGDKHFIWHLNAAPMDWDAHKSLMRREYVPGMISYYTNTYKPEGSQYPAFTQPRRVPPTSETEGDAR